MSCANPRPLAGPASNEKAHLCEGAVRFTQLSVFDLLLRYISPCQDEDGVAVVPGVPEELVRTYYHHDVFGDKFRAFVDGLVEEYGTIHAYKEAATRVPSVKRQNGSPTAEPAKRLKVAVSPVVLGDLGGVETRKAGVTWNTGE